MTYKELFIKEYLNHSDEKIDEIISACCPSDYYGKIADTYPYCKNVYGDDDVPNCEECWNREVDDRVNIRLKEGTNHEEINNFIEKNEPFESTKEPSGIPHILDSGNRREFETGAVRDMKAGKGDMVSLPNAAILRISKHYEAGALKYGRWNYTKGIPVSAFMDSALRHIFKYLDGWDDEDHLSAAAFNILGAIEMEENHKELIDIPTREGKNTFDYKSNSEA